ncbi:MAG: Zn-ribbon domain-containing OB-fold protein [Solirubrobacterales bacterium]
MSAGPSALLGDLDPLEAQLWQALQAERIEFQRCQACGHAWLPPSAECPRCLAPGWRWQAAAGGGELVSWVVYHRAFHPALEDRLPYAVALVELDEGPRMVTTLAGVPGPAEPACGAPVELEVVDLAGTMLARARLV